jgi:methyl-accepting chemotaxis protein
MSLKNLNIGTRLWMGFGLVIVFLVGLVLFALTSMQTMNTRTSFILSDRYRKVVAIEAVQLHALTAYRGMRDALLAIDVDREDALKEIARIDSSRKKAGELLENLDKAIASPHGKQLLAAILAARASDLEAQKEFLAMVTSGRQLEAKAFLTSKMNAVQTQYLDSLRELNDFQSTLMSQDAALNEADFVLARNWLAGVSILAMVLAALIAWRVARGITGPLRNAVTITRSVAAGNLTGKIEVRGNDETGQLLHALQEMKDGLLKIVTEVRHGTLAIAVSSGQIASGNMDLSSRTEQQASSLEETASSMEELTSAVKQNADNARQANQLALAASDMATKGGAVVSRVVGTMGEINHSARKIADIISVIDGIAFQTNILALNAAVEAARAGEQGRGFAVVATEVRSLAQRSAAAAKEIKTLIGDSVQKVDAGAKLVDDAGATMDQVVASVKRVADIIAEITSAGQEQSSGIEQVNQAIAQMDQVTQQNAALVEQSAAAAASMEEQAGHLTRAVSRFTLDNEGASIVPKTNVRLPAPEKPRLALNPQRAIAGNVAAPKIARRPVSVASREAVSMVPRKPRAEGSDDEWEEF